MITGRVIRIISKKRVILNVGEDAGVQEDMQFGVYTPEEMIMDPDTGLNLGGYRRQKTVIEVFDRFPPHSARTLLDPRSFGYAVRLA